MCYEWSKVRIEKTQKLSVRDCKRLHEHRRTRKSAYFAVRARKKSSEVSVYTHVERRCME